MSGDDKSGLRRAGPAEGVPLSAGQEYDMGLPGGGRHLRGGPGAVQLLPGVGSGSGADGYGGICHADPGRRPADGAGGVRQGGQAGGGGNAGPHHGLCQRHGLPGAGVQKRGAHHRDGGQAVCGGGAGAGLRDQRQRAVRADFGAGRKLLSPGFPVEDHRERAALGAAIAILY